MRRCPAFLLWTGAATWPMPPWAWAPDSLAVLQACRPASVDLASVARRGQRWATSNLPAVQLDRACARDPRNGDQRPDHTGRPVDRGYVFARNAHRGLGRCTALCPCFAASLSPNSTRPLARFGVHLDRTGAHRLGSWAGDAAMVMYVSASCPDVCYGSNSVQGEQICTDTAEWVCLGCFWQEHQQT
jgi:hypothetical protein